ncbi:MAG: hypothetical protein KDI30_12875, partial [Pseudomonadales bacterium]|nr:hypothetical protein [Pseudomonadales bacterium]
FDLKWYVNTVVRRVAPAQGSLVVKVPVLAGESVVTQGVKVKEGFIDIVMGEGQNHFVWNSLMEPVASLQLSAGQNNNFVELWQFELSSLWHVTTSGLLPVKPKPGVSTRHPLWRPWPGEMLEVSVERPQAVEGPTVTVDNVVLEYRPGKRSSESSMQLDIRSSQGGNYRFSLPENAEVQSLKVDGQEQNTPADNSAIILSLHPGFQRADIKWTQEEVIGTRTMTPAVKLQTSPYNIVLEMQVPRDRWSLLVGGPDMGPAMLYWGVLLVIVLLAFLLGRFRKIPVSTWQWLLLGIGMSTVTAIGTIFVVLWFFALARRAEAHRQLSDNVFNLSQLMLVLLTIAALASLLATIPLSLLSSPNMQVTGNGSSAYHLIWYQDHFREALPQGWLISLPIGVYRLAMLLWSLWLVYSLLEWLRWGWGCFSQGGLWRKPGSIKSSSDEKMSVAVKAVADDIGKGE